MLAAITLVGGIALVWLLPKERHFHRSEGLAAAGRQMLQHFRNPHLLATFAIGFGVLFNFIATFTYVGFYLAGPPYGFSPSLLGAIFVTYLVGAVIAPFVGRPIRRFGRRGFMLGILALWTGGALIMLYPHIVAILIGLTLCAGCGLLSQTVATGFVTVTARAGRSSAVGLYVTAFYTGGAFGAFLPGLAWTHGGWPAAMSMVVAMLVIMAIVVAFAWKEPVTVAAAR